MPRNKEGKKRSQPNSENVMAAANMVLEDGVSVRKAAKESGVKRTTLQRYLAYQTGKTDPTTYFNRCAVWTVFTREEEVELVQYLLQCSKMHYGLSRTEVKKLAFDYAKLNGKTYPPTWNRDSKAGDQWYLDFMKRHEAVISLRKPQATSLARATSFNRANVNTFFDKYSEVIEKHNFPPERLYNVDESGITTVHNPVKVVAGKGVKQVGSVTSGERGLNTTIICAVNAIGNAVPPMMIFPRVHYKDHMIKGAPPGTMGAAHMTGWSTSEKFLEYLNHFIYHVKPSPEEKVLLLLDNHETHVTIEAIDVCKSNGIVLLTFPLHTSHKLQPLDRGVYGPLKKYYNTVCTE
ncbi:jerky protein homolog-like isoform X1 [Homalodisca vitripennis]|uniref:jerky protein homolog-like isoform X1 n=1 Tax=Homalodisca vitripennis TaxID=197043 RepID=UPI001EEB67AE|nr:jerky protein homolog-like isoform X1 [Homalodisca vitripennis]